MKYRYLGNSGLLVSRICLGTMTFGNEEWGCDQAESTRITRAFVEGGGNFIDTADLYTAGVSERMLGEAIRELKRDDLVVATKCWFPTGDGVNARGLSRKHIFEACEASLRRLGTEYIDLYQVHGPDPHTPVEETMRALDDLVRAGKVRYLGCSNLYAWQIVKTNGVAERLGLERFIAAQHLYNLVRRDVEREILPACEDQGLGIICWSPLASGLLTGKYRGHAKPPDESRFGIQASIYLPRYWWDESLRVVDGLVECAAQQEKTPAQVALAWLLRDKRVSSVIVGARRVEQIRENLAAGDWDLPDEAWKRLTEAMPLKQGYPKDWMDFTFPGTFGRAEFTPRHTERLP
jgi:1-deoxyxylulose-5-phosphate synthase